MSSWKVRHAGSPQSRTDATPEAIVQGLRDGVWEPTDEVIGPEDAEWVTIESHPAFEEAMLDIEPEPPRYDADETKLDMNPLIDVALVLLIFFILTTTYQSLRRVIDMPSAEIPEEGARPVPVVQAEELDQRAVFLTARMEAGKPVIRMGGEPIPADELEMRLAREMDRTGKQDLLYDVRGVPWGTEVKIIDAAKGAGVRQVMQSARREES